MTWENMSHQFDPSAASSESERGVDRAQLANELFNRRLVEYCCNPDSKFGQHKWQSEGCECIRLVENEDMGTNGGLEMTF